MRPYGAGPGARIVPAPIAGEEPGIELVRIDPQGREVVVLQRVPAPNGACTNVFWVVLLLVVLFVIFALILIYGTGAGKPDHGDSFAESSDRLRNDSADRLHTSRPTGWSGGVEGAADSYDRKVSEQRLRVDRVAQADQQLADLVAMQAGDVEQGRQDLADNLDTLASGITVAGALQSQWVALAAVGSPAAPAVAAALVAFGKTVAGTTTTSGLGVCRSLTDAGDRTQQALSDVIDTYRWIVDSVAATIPAGWAPAAEFRTTLRPPISSSLGSNSTTYDLPDASVVIGAATDTPDAGAALGMLIGQFAGDNRTLRQPRYLSAITAQLARLVPQRSNAAAPSTTSLAQPSPSAVQAAPAATVRDRGVGHSMQDTQPSTSVPSNAI
ncbi:MAG: hypothetical protein K2Q25_05730 [Mycobacteriaceae bacterium]|nr:hypothetical protein [Mycobacteriaceae bacterium]